MWKKREPDLSSEKRRCPRNCCRRLKNRQNSTESQNFHTKFRASTGNNFWEFSGNFLESYCHYWLLPVLCLDASGPVVLEMGSLMFVQKSGAVPHQHMCQSLYIFFAAFLVLFVSFALPMFPAVITCCSCSARFSGSQ